jgi:predicted helicase
VTSFGSYKNMPWTELQPNEHHDWINQRSGDFNAFVPFNDEPSMRSSRCAPVAWKPAGMHGSTTQAETSLVANMKRMIDFYNSQLQQHGVKRARLVDQPRSARRSRHNCLDPTRKKIKWTSSLISDLARGTSCSYV